jgi:hypothetical protein
MLKSGYLKVGANFANPHRHLNCARESPVNYNDEGRIWACFSHIFDSRTLRSRRAQPTLFIGQAHQEAGIGRNRSWLPKESPHNSTNKQPGPSPHPEIPPKCRFPIL